METVEPEQIDLNKFKRVFLVNTTPNLFEKTVFHGLSLFELLFKDRNAWFDPGKKQRKQWLNQLLQIEGKYLGISKKVMDKVIRPLALARLNPWDRQSEDILSWTSKAIETTVDDVQFINELPDGQAKIIWFTKFKKARFSDIKKAWPVYKKLMLKNRCLFNQFSTRYAMRDENKDNLVFYWSMIKPYLERNLKKDGIVSPSGITYMDLTVGSAYNMSEYFLDILMRFYGKTEETEEYDFFDNGKKIEFVERGQYKGTGVVCRTKNWRYWIMRVTENFIKFVDDRIDGLSIMELKKKLKQLREKQKDIREQAKENMSDISKVKEKLANVTKMLKSQDLGK